MYSYKDISGTVFVGATPQQVVQRLRKFSWVTVPKSQYMRDVARRLRVLGTTGIKTNNSKAFVDSLVKTGWLTPFQPR